MTGQENMDIALLFYITVKIGQDKFSDNDINVYSTIRDDSGAIYTSKMERRGYETKTVQRRDWSHPPDYPMKDFKAKSQRIVFVIYKNNSIIFESEVLKSANMQGIHGRKELSMVFQQMLEK